MSKPHASIGENADGDAVIVTCTSGDAAGTHGKVLAALKCAGLKPDDIRAGWFKFWVPEEWTLAKAKATVRSALASQGIDA